MIQRYRIQQDKGEYCLKACDDGDLIEWTAHEAIIKRQASAALAGLNAAKAISSNDVQRAAQLRAESSPDALESERQANAKLTQELSLAEEGLANYAQENGRMRAALEETLSELQLADARHDLMAKIILALRSREPQAGEQT